MLVFIALQRLTLEHPGVQVQHHRRLGGDVRVFRSVG
jgi:hypothetical protein